MSINTSKDAQKSPFEELHHSRMSSAISQTKDYTEFKVLEKVQVTALPDIGGKVAEKPPLRGSLIKPSTADKTDSVRAIKSPESERGSSRRSNRSVKLAPLNSEVAQSQNATEVPSQSASLGQ